jgi:hypothetical protein
VSNNSSFSEWFKWKDRQTIKRINYPGVYLLAKFNQKPSGSAKQLNKNIIYVGETCNNTILGRLSQFENSAFYGKNGHSGGWSYRAYYKSKDKGKDLYVSILAIKDGHLSDLLIRYTERKIIYTYGKKYGEKPLLNKK